MTSTAARFPSCLWLAAFLIFPVSELSFAKSQSIADRSPSCPLVWSDEFDASNDEPDPDNWYYRVGGNDVNGEKQYYTARRRNARIEQGHLLIESHIEPFEKYLFTSARMVSHRSFQYGYFEIRAKLPIGAGSWAAIWLLSEDRLVRDAAWPLTGEIDIIEHLGYEPDVIHASVQTVENNWIHGNNITEVVAIPNTQTEFQTYALDWQPNYVVAYINDREVFRYDKPEDAKPENWPFDRKFKLILNNAIGGGLGGKKGIDMGSFPQQFEIDYVRAYSRKYTPEDHCMSASLAELTGESN